MSHCRHKKVHNNNAAWPQSECSRAGRARSFASIFDKRRTCNGYLEAIIHFLGLNGDYGLACHLLTNLLPVRLTSNSSTPKAHHTVGWEIFSRDNLVVKFIHCVIFL